MLKSPRKVNPFHGTRTSAVLWKKKEGTPALILAFRRTDLRLGTSIQQPNIILVLISSSCGGNKEEKENCFSCVATFASTYENKRVPLHGLKGLRSLPRIEIMSRECPWYGRAVGHTYKTKCMRVPGPWPCLRRGIYRYFTEASDYAGGARFSLWPLYPRS